MQEEGLEAVARNVFHAGLDAVRPARLLTSTLHVKDCPDGKALELVAESPNRQQRGSLALPVHRPLWIFGFGKAVFPMAQHICSMLKDRVNIQGQINVPEGTRVEGNLCSVHVAPCGANNMPDKAAVQASTQLLQTLSTVPDGDPILLLISGGGSALLVHPAAGISLDDYTAVVRALARNGASIQELNCVRKHISHVKGGRLAAAVPEASAALALVVSDVVGDDLSVIACGPTVPDDTTFADCMAVLQRFGLQDEMPTSVIQHLQRGAAGEVDDTPPRDHPCFSRVQHVLIGTNTTALDACERAAREEHGCRIVGIPAPITGLVEDAAAYFVDRLPQWLPHGRERVCVLAGGETVVRVTGSGKGGRNQELALRVAKRLHDTPSLPISANVVFLSGGTDGQDGPTPAAGAIANSSTWQRGKESGLDPDRVLETNDSYTFWSALDDGRHHLTPGLTGTNVMDVAVLVLQGADS